MTRKTRKTAKSGKIKKSVKKENSFDLVAKSITDLRKNPVVLVPGLVGLGLILLLSGFLAIQVFTALSFLETLDPDHNLLFVAFVLLFFLLDVALYVIINAYYGAVQYGMITDVLAGRKISFRRVLKHGKVFFGKMLSLSIAKFAVYYVVPAVVMGLIVLPISLVSPAAAVMAALILVAFVYVPVLIVFSVITVFHIPILIEKKISGVLSGFRVIIESFRYGEANLFHVGVTVLVVLGLWIIMTAVSIAAGLPALIIESVLVEDSAHVRLYLSSFAIYLVKALISLVGGMVITFFIFNSYFNRNRLRWK